MDEKALVEAAQAGDNGAVDVLLDHHLPGLRAFIRLRMGPVLRARESASDLSQSVCREVLHHMDRLQYPGEHAFKHWLYTTAMRKISNRHDYYTADKRDIQREQAVASTRSQTTEGSARSLSQLYQTVYTPSRDAMAREHVEQVESAFDELSDEYREVIMLSRFMGLSRAEVAEAMGRTESSVRNLLHRALSRLAELLEPEEA